MPTGAARKPRRVSHGDRFVFRHAETALWEQDVSALRALAREWKRAGIGDLRAYLVRHPEVLRTALDAIIVVDVNETALALYGGQSAEDLRSPWDPQLDAASAPACAEVVHSIVNGNDGVRIACRARTAAGRPFDVVLRLHPPNLPEGFPHLLVNALPADTEQDQRVARAVMDAIPDQILAKDPKGSYLIGNRTLAAWAGEACTEDLLGKSDLDYFPREIAEKYRADDARVMESGEPRVNIEEEVRSASGESRWALTTKVPLRDRQGKVAGVVIIVRDITDRKVLEQRLDEERRLMRTLIDSLPDCIFMKDHEGRFLLANDALGAVMGARTSDELIGRTDRDFYPAARADAFAREERRVLQDGQTIVNEPGAWSVAGERRWFRVTKVPLRDREGAITGLVGISRDVTEQRNAEAQLSTQRSYLTALMDSSPDHIYFKDRQSRFLMTSRAHARLFRLADPVQVVGKTDFDFFSPEHARSAFNDEQRIISTGEPLIDLEERETWPDRPDTWVTTTKLPLKDGEGVIIGTFGISRDITQRRQIEERNLLLAAMVEHSNDAIIGVDLEDRVTSWNRGAEKVFGYGAQEMEGRSIALLMSPESAAQAPAATESPPQRGVVRQFESAVTRKDGKQVLVSSTISPIEDSVGRIIGTTLISRDVTEQKTLLAQVIRAQRLESLGTLAAGIAHQFNNINAAIQGYLDVAMGEEGVPERARSWTREALKGVQRSVEITERLQSFSSAAHSGQEVIDLADVVPKILPLFDAVVNEQGARIRTELAPAAVRASRPTLNFVITSLVNNSLHALLECPRREILLRSRSAGAYGVLEVEDSGCGITVENLPRVFTPFFTTKGEWAEPGSPQAKVKGIGLSLSVCQSTVAEQGGWLEVESRHGEGSTIRVWLPSGQDGAPA